LPPTSRVTPLPFSSTVLNVPVWAVTETKLFVPYPTLLNVTPDAALAELIRSCGDARRVAHAVDRERDG
jgi:hypothetical protein